MNNEYEIAFDRIKEEMKLRKITANTLAKKTNINVSTIKKILEQENDMKVSQLLAICKALDFKIEQVFRKK